VDGRKIFGEVSFISRSADKVTRTFQIEVTVPNEDLSVSAGQTADITISAQGTLAHLLPGSALTLNDSGTLGLRVLGDANTVRFVPVTLIRDTVQGGLGCRTAAGGRCNCCRARVCDRWGDRRSDLYGGNTMTGLVDWAIARARMVLAFIMLSLAVGTFAYAVLPKEGEPDIEIPALIISMPFQGISAEDSEKLLIKPMETELSDLDGLKKLTATAVDGYANVVLEFEFGWDKTKIIADVRDRMGNAQTKFPNGGDTYSISEFNFSEFPIIIISLSGSVPERTLLKVAQDLQDRIEGLEPVLSAGLTGHREEMLEVLIDPLKLESYNVTAGELIGVVVNNNQLIPAGSVDTENSNFSVKIPSSFNAPVDVFNLPVKTNGDRVVTLGDIADIRLTFADRTGTARFNGETTVAIQVVKAQRLQPDRHGQSWCARKWQNKLRFGPSSCKMPLKSAPPTINRGMWTVWSNSWKAQSSPPSPW